MSVFRVGLHPTVLSNQAYRSLRAAILTGKLSGGSQLVVRELSESLELSPTPIKSALTTLESEGLVVSVPYRGFFMPTFDVSDITEIFGVREALERKTARLAALRRHPQSLGKLESLLNRQKTHRDAATGLEDDLDFHQLIAEASGNSRLFDLAYTVLSQAHLLLATSAGFSETASLGEHERIVTAIAAGQPDAAEEASWHHNRITCLALVQYFQDRDDVSGAEVGIEALLSYNSSLKLALELEQPYLEQTLTKAQKDALYDALAEYIGPMAIVVCSDVLGKHVALESALEQLAKRIPDPAKAAQFIADARTYL